MKTMLLITITIFMIVGCKLNESKYDESGHGNGKAEAAEATDITPKQIEATNDVTVIGLDYFKGTMKVKTDLGVVLDCDLPEDADVSLDDLVIIQMVFEEGAPGEFCLADVFYDGKASEEDGL